MSIDIIYPYTTEGNYTFDSDDIELSAGKAQLKLQQGDVDFTEDFADDTGFTYDNTKAEFTGGLVRQKLSDIIGQSFTEDFADDTDFVYDSNLAEFSGGQVQQINKRPTDAICYNNFEDLEMKTNPEDINFGNGTKAGVLGDGAVVSEGILDFSSGGYWEGNPDNLSSMTQEGCIIVRKKFGYTGNAPSVQYLIQTSTNTISRVYLVHNTNLIQCYVSNSSGVIIFNMTFAWNPSNANKFYEFAVNWNATTGQGRILIDGVTQDTDTGTGTINAPTIFRLGANASQLGAIDQVLVYDTVQHTSNYTPNWSDIPDADYLASKVELPIMTYSGIQIKEFIGITSTESGTPKYILDDKYWSGSAWVASDGSYSQANTLVEVNANIGSLTPTGATLNIDVVFDISYSQSSVDNLQINYTGNVYVETSVILPEMEHTGDGTIKLFNSLTSTYVGSPRILLEIGRSGDKLYWNGSAWVTSDETYDQATDPVTFNTNCSTLDVDGENYGQFTIVFPDSNTLSAYDTLTANMNVDIGYLTTNPTILTNTSFKSDGLVNFIETAIKNGSDQIKYTLLKDSTEYWNNTGTWETSDGTYSQSNLASEILTYIDDFLTEGYGYNIKVKAFLHSDDGTSTPYLDNILISYNFSGDDYTLSETVIYSNNFTIDGEALIESLTVKPVYNIYGLTTIIRNEEVIVTIQNNGYFEVHLYTEDVEPDYLLWKFNGKRVKTNFVSGYVKFSELTII